MIQTYKPVQKMFAAMNSNLTPISRDHNKKLVKIIQALLAQEQSNLFRKPIPHKSLGWEDYKQIVKKPIDLNMVRRQYNQGKYKTIQQFFDDIQTIWENVFLYGKKQHQTYQMAFKMQKHYDQLLSDLFPQIYSKFDRVAYMKRFQEQKKSNNKQTKKNQTRNSPSLMKGAQKQKPFNYRNSLRAEKMDLQINNKQETLLSTSNKKQLSNLNYRRGKGSNIIIEQQNNLVPQKKQKVPKNIPSTSQPAQKSQRIPPVVVSIQPEIKVIPQNPIIQQKPIQQQTIQQKQTLTIHNNSIASSQQLSVIPPQFIQPQSEPQNQIPPIIVNLNRNPSVQQISQLTQIMNHLFKQQQFELIQRIVKILTKYEKQCMIIDGEDVNFRMNQIHISTYERIKKQLDTKAGNYMNGNSNHIISAN